MAVIAPDNMGPEHRLLFACSRTLLADADQAELSRVLAEDLDWSLVTELAEWHRLSPLLFAHLRVGGRNSHVPWQAMQRLHAAYYTTASRAALYEGELASVLDILNRSRIPVILLKGSALIHNVYQDPGWRSMNDLDVLVPQDRIHAAERALVKEGWSPMPGSGSVEMWESFRHVPPLQNEAGTVSVELHRDLVSPPLHWDIEQVWERSSRSEYLGPASIPSPEDLLAHVSLHFFMDRHEVRPGALRQLMDIAEIVRRYPTVDWDLLLADAERHGNTGALACGLWAAHRLMSVPIPGWAANVVGIDEEGADAFIRQRVLGHSPWPLRGLVEPEETYTAVRAIRNTLRRLFPSRRYLQRKYSAASRFPPLWLAHHLRDLAARWKASIFQPMAVREALVADRWLHSLVNESPTGLPDQ